MQGGVVGGYHGQVAPIVPQVVLPLPTVQEREGGPDARPIRIAYVRAQREPLLIREIGSGVPPTVTSRLPVVPVFLPSNSWSARDGYEHVDGLVLPAPVAEDLRTAETKFRWALRTSWAAGGWILRHAASCLRSAPHIPYNERIHNAQSRLLVAHQDGAAGSLLDVEERNPPLLVGGCEIKVQA